MDFFCSIFFANTDILSGNVIIAIMLIIPFSIYLFLLILKGTAKWFSIDEAFSYDQLEFQKAKWDAIENKQLLRMGGHIGFDGAGVEFEHDNRERRSRDPLKVRLKRLESFFYEGLISDEEYGRRKQEILEEI